MRTEGSVAVVTGGTGGLGRRIAHALAAAGADVAMVCHQAVAEAEALAAALEAEQPGCRTRAFRADVGVASDVERLRDEVLVAFGAVDVLVNDAALNRWIPFGDLDALTPEVWDDIVRTNATGPYLCSRAFAPALRAGAGGRIVNISSIAGRDPQGSSIAYAVSKAALDHLTRCLAVALAPDVLVNGVAPGYMEGTAMSARLPPERVAHSVGSSLLQRPTDRDDVAAQVVAFVRSDSTTGQTICVDAGRVFP